MNAWRSCWLGLIIATPLLAGEFEKARTLMVTSQIEARGGTNAPVLAAMLKVPRHDFVPERLRAAAYDDGPLPIGYGQTISQPFIVGLMTEMLQLKRGDKVLEIGTGSGYQAAVLAEITDKVFTMEIIEALADAATGRLKRLRSGTGQGRGRAGRSARGDHRQVLHEGDHRGTGRRGDGTIEAARLRQGAGEVRRRLLRLAGAGAVRRSHRDRRGRSR